MVIKRRASCPLCRFPHLQNIVEWNFLLFFLPFSSLLLVTARLFRTLCVGRELKEFASAHSTFPSRRSAATPAGKHLEEVSSNNFLLLSPLSSDSCCSLQVMLLHFPQAPASLICPRLVDISCSLKKCSNTEAHFNFPQV